MKWMLRNTLIILSLMLLMASSCKEREQPEAKSYEQVREELFEMNRQKSRAESDRIDAFVAEKGWIVTTTGTGLRYFIYEHGTGEKAVNGKVALVNYEVRLLDGTLCYASEPDQPKEFLIGQDDVESGLHEGILHMHVGDKAKMILPSHLAHGFTGDQQRIPMDASIVYDVELLGLR